MFYEGNIDTLLFFLSSEHFSTAFICNNSVCECKMYWRHHSCHLLKVSTCARARACGENIMVSSENSLSKSPFSSLYSTSCGLHVLTVAVGILAPTHPSCTSPISGIFCTLLVFCAWHPTVRQSPSSHLWFSSEMTSLVTDMLACLSTWCFFLVNWSTELFFSGGWWTMTGYMPEYMPQQYSVNDFNRYDYVSLLELIGM